MSLCDLEGVQSHITYGAGVRFSGRMGVLSVMVKGAVMDLGQIAYMVKIRNNLRWMTERLRTQI